MLMIGGLSLSFQTRICLRSLEKNKTIPYKRPFAKARGAQTVALADLIGIRLQAGLHLFFPSLDLHLEARPKKENAQEMEISNPESGECPG